MAVMFKSPYLSVDIPRCSFVQHLFTDGKTRFSRSAPAYVDGVTGETCSRGQLESEALALAGAFRNVGLLGLVGLSRGSTVTVFSPNSLVYPKIIHALVSRHLDATIHESHEALTYVLSYPSGGGRYMWRVRQCHLHGLRARTCVQDQQVDAFPRRCNTAWDNCDQPDLYGFLTRGHEEARYRAHKEE